MLLYPPSVSGAGAHTRPRPSYEVPVFEGATPAETISAFYHQRWLASVSSHDSPHTVTQFVLFRVLSWTDSEVMRGRATRVWHAWLKSDYENIEDPYLRPVRLWSAG